MKATGVIRKVDELGRIVIPKELRDVLGIQIKSPLEIFVEADKIILQKYQPYNACQIIGDVSEQNISLANGNITVGIEGAEYLVKEIEKFLNKSEV
ncbi:AbrB/MazE/SpoVT family DNA-binding domain-containing protein [Bacillus cereus]